MSQFMKISMQMFMEPYDLRRGIILDFFDGSKATIFGRVSILLGDEAALKETLDCKGAAGTFFCALYINICDHKSQLHSHDTRGYLQPSTCLNLDLFRPNTDESVMETLRELSRWKATLPKTRFQKKEQEAGWNLNQNGLLLSGLHHVRLDACLCGIRNVAAGSHAAPNRTAACWNHASDVAPRAAGMALARADLLAVRQWAKDLRQETRGRQR